MLNFFSIITQLNPLVLQWNFVADNIKSIFSMSNVIIVVDTKLQPNNFCIFQIKQNRFTSSERINLRVSPFDLGTCRSDEP